MRRSTERRIDELQMIIHGYSANFYCDGDHYFDWSNPTVFTGNTKTEVFQKARKAGWRISQTKALCPECVKKGKRINNRPD